MLRSMTGFGSAAGQVEGVDFSVEIRSVNNRYLKSAIKLPECYNSIETQIDRLLRERIARGTVTCTVRMRITDEQAAHEVNVAALAKYIEQLRSVEMDANSMLRIDLSVLLQLPGICRPAEIDELTARYPSKFVQHHFEQFLRSTWNRRRFSKYSTVVFPN